MGFKRSACIAILLFVTVSQGCELQALMDATLSCSGVGENFDFPGTGGEFNITKFLHYITILDNDGYNASSAEEFFQKHPFAEMAQVFGELEPAVVWLMDSFYKEHLADLTNEKFIRPMFGNMSNMDSVLQQALVKHCKITDELFGCMETQMKDKCSKESDAVFLITEFLTPLQGRYCDGTTVKTAALTWMGDHSDGLTEAFSCFVDPDHPDSSIDFIDFENHPVILTTNFDYILRKCNARAVWPAIEDWYFENLAGIFEGELDFATFNVMTLLDMNIPKQFFSLLRPMADCFVNELLPFPKRLCPALDINSQILKLKNVMEFMVPLFLDEQEIGFNIVLNPLPTPNMGSPDRYGIGMFGNTHVYDGKKNEWTASCYSPVSNKTTLLLSIGPFSAYRTPEGEIILKDHESYSSSFNFNNTGIFLSMSILGVDIILPFEDAISTYTATGLAVLTGVTEEMLEDTDYETYMRFLAPEYGVVVSFDNPSGSNWMLSYRAGAGLHRLAYGVLPRGCGAKGSQTMDKIIEAAGTAIPQCAAACSSLSVMQDPCKADCSDGLPGMASEKATFDGLSVESRKFDRVLMNGAVNVDTGYGAPYGPCSALGFISNVGGMCAWEATLAGKFPDFENMITIVDLASGIGLMEPYIFLGMSAVVNKFRRPINQGEPINYASFLADATFNGVMDNHCGFSEVMTDCLERRLPGFCPGTHTEMIEDYIKPLKTRYCTTDKPSVRKADVVQAMMDARDGLVDEMTCFVNDTIKDYLSFDMNKLEKIYQQMLDRCEFGNIMFFINQIGLDEEGEILNTLKELIRVARNPIRCVLKVVEPHCPGIDIGAMVDKLLVHLNRATAGTFSDIDRSYFINDKAVNYGSKERVSMWAVGDPHIRTLGTTEFQVCNAPGWNKYFRSEEKMIVELKANNVPVNEFTNATVIKNVKLCVWEPGKTDEDEPAVCYEANNGVLADTFTNGEIDVVVGDFSIFIEKKDKLKAAFISNVNTGTLFAIQGFKDFFNIVVRTSKSYAETAVGLLISCPDGKDASILNAEAVNPERRRKRAVTAEECEQACSAVPDYLQQSCNFDCVVTEDTEVAGAHSSAVEVEVETVVEDEVIIKWLPDLDEMTTTVEPTVKTTVKTTVKDTPDSASTLVLSCYLFILTIFVLFQ